MANHVNSYIRIRTISEEGQKVWDSICQKISGRELFGDNSHLGAYFTDDEDEITVTNMCNWVGAKWAYAEDIDECGMRIMSAWSPCSEFVEEVINVISEVDESIQIEYTYEDEMPNFIGVALYDQDGLVDCSELEWDEIKDEMINEYDELREQWDEDEDEWKDEGDLLQELLWEWTSDWQYKAIDSM